MREPDSLPTDPDDWPHDPATLFGIEPRAEEATIRRAYLKLVRRFKPDTHPQQFQLIRQAYETLLARAASVAPPSAPRVHSEAPVRSDAEQPLNPLATSQAEPAADDVKLRNQQQDETRKLRQLIKAGEFSRVRETVQTKLTPGATNVEQLLIGTLLQMAAPAFAELNAPHPSSPPLDQLLGELLKRSPAVGLNLLRERWRASPQLAREPQVAKHLERLADPRHKAELLMLRWGCLETEDWETVLDDFEGQRSWSFDFQEQWVWLGAEVLKFAGWHQHSPRAKAFIERFQEELQSVPYQLQERVLLVLDELQAIQAELVGKENSLLAFSWRLIPHSYTRHLSLVVKELVPFWTTAQKDPLLMLRQLKKDLDHFPNTLQALRSLVRKAYHALIDTELVSEEEQAAAVCKFLNQRGNASLAAMTPAILGFCVANGLDLVRFSYFADTHLDGSLLPPVSTNADRLEWTTICRRDAALDCLTMLLQLPLAQV
jgi:hypothetical protein